MRKYFFNDHTNNHYRNSLWPDGVRATDVQFRDAEVQLRTLVAAKCALMSSVSGKSVPNNILIKCINIFYAYI